MIYMLCFMLWNKHVRYQTGFGNANCFEDGKH